MAVAKARHAVQWHAEASRTAPLAVAPPVVAPAATVYLRKRREAPANEAPEVQTPETNNKDKRQILAYSAAYSPVAYPAYGSYPYAAIPYASSAYPYASHAYPYSSFLLRKRRDVSTETEEPKAPESNNQKRQILTSWGFPSTYAPVAYSAYSAYPSPLSYSAYPYASPIASPFLFRKRRDVSATEEDHSEAGSDDERKKRQLLLTGAYPYAAFSYSAAWPYRAYSAAPIAYYG